MKTEIVTEPVKCVTICKSENVPPHMTVEIELYKLISLELTFWELAHVEVEAYA